MTLCTINYQSVRVLIPNSIGLGGGSIVRITSRSHSSLSIGPDSVGLNVQTHALVFGGDVPTATDYAVAISEGNLSIGDPGRIPEFVRDATEEYLAALKGMLEGIIDRMKTNADDIDVLLVGGVRVLPDLLALYSITGCLL